MQDSVRVRGIVRLFDADTGETLVETHNLLVERGGVIVASLIIGKPGYTGPTYCALGTGATAPSTFDSKLVAEAARDQVTQTDVNGHASQISTFFSSTDCGIAIKEVGLFGNSPGLEASGAADSGALFARALLNYDNSVSPRNLMVGWEIPIEAAP